MKTQSPTKGTGMHRHASPLILPQRIASSASGQSYLARIFLTMTTTATSASANKPAPANPPPPPNPVAGRVACDVGWIGPPTPVGVAAPPIPPVVPPVVPPEIRVGVAPPSGVTSMIPEVGVTPGVVAGLSG